MVVKRATKVWPRVGGGDGPTTRQTPTTTTPAKPNEDKARATADNDMPTNLRGKGAKGAPPPPPGPAAASNKGSVGKGRLIPTKPPWADQDDDVDEGGDEFDDDDLFGEGPARDQDAHGQMDDDEMHDLDGDEDWAEGDDEDGDQYDQYDHDVDEVQGGQQDEVEKLERAWRTKKSIFESVAWRFWKGDPEFEDAREQRDQAYDDWQAARKAESTPKLATLHQRKQKAVDRARRKVESTKQAMEQALSKHHEYMEEQLNKLRQEQLRLEEAESSLQQFMLQVADHAEGGGKRVEAEQPGNQGEARDQMVSAKRDLEAVQSQLQDLYDKLEEQGNFVALDQINAVYGSLAGAVGGVEGAEQLLARKPKPRWNRAQYYTMDAQTDGNDGGRKSLQPSGAGIGEGEGGNAGSRSSNGGEGPKGSLSSSPSRVGSAPGGTTGGGAAAAATAAGGAVQRGQAEGDAKPEDAAQVTVIRFGGAESEEQEKQLLQAEAGRALEQARAKFAEADQGPNTDNAALLFAHQCVLAKVGTPSTLVEVHAFERWRKALGESLEQLAAERQREGGTYW